MSLAVVEKPTASLVPYARNARTHSEAQIAQVAASIREFGFCNPVLVDPEGGIIAGHCRVEAALLLGLATVPCIELGHLTAEQRRAFVLADNRLALNAGWDEELLRLELESLQGDGFDLGLLGFTDTELLDYLSDDAPGLTDPDAVPEPGEPVCRPGDVWILGAHRLVCGSATEAADWHALMQGERADLCVTDPPYNVDYQGGTKDALKIKNDHLEAREYAAFLEAALERIYAALRPGGVVYLAHADTEGLVTRTAFDAAGFKLAGCLVWQKDTLVLGRSDYQWQHEPILYGWRPGKAHYWRGGRRRTTVVRWGDERLVRPVEDGRWAITVGDTVLLVESDAKIEQRPGSVLLHERPRRSQDHPTIKPVGLWEKLIRPSSRSGDLVIDPFAGSGTTLIAAEMTGLRARCLELDPKFCDVCLRRWQAFTGQRPVLEGDGREFEEVEHAGTTTEADASTHRRRKPRKATAKPEGAEAER